MEAFSTLRLKATKLVRGDLRDLVELHRDPDVSRFLGGVRTPEATAAYLETNLRHWADHGVGLWTVRTPDGTFVGRAGLRYVDVEGVRELEVAYTFVKQAWGQGLATEVAQTLVEVCVLRDAPYRGLLSMTRHRERPPKFVRLRSELARVSKPAVAFERAAIRRKAKG